MPTIDDAESHGPRRPAPSAARAQVQTPSSERLRWRAIVHASHKLDTSGGPRLAWHLASCAEPGALESHCEVGRLLMAGDGNPDGHCMVEGVCPRCPTSSTPPAPT